MTMESMSPATPRPHLEHSGVKRIVEVLLTMVFIGALLFLSAGRLDWEAGWVYMGLYLLSILCNMVVGFRLNPEIINERGRSGGNVKDWDKALTKWLIPVGLALYIVAGLDGGRFHWSAVPTGVQVAGGVGLVLALAVINWMFAVNAYAATVVRIQTERGHHVVSAGPYRYVRHPMYAANIVSSVSAALLLGSWWALIPAVLNGGLFILRTALEDRTLQAELPGYAEYAARVRFRLLPGVW